MARKLKITEDMIQRRIAGELDLFGKPGTFSFHVPNGGKRSATEAAIFKGLGVKSGVPDMIIISEGRTYALELKTDKGKLSQAQQRVLAEMESAGATVAVAYGLDAALRQIRAWDLVQDKPNGLRRKLVDQASISA